jgi:hypothetical protein
VAITSYDTAIAGALPPEAVLKVSATAEAAGVLHSTLYASGRPGAGAAPAPGIDGAALTAYAGQVPFPAAVGGKNIHLLSLAASQSASGMSRVWLLDRLWHNSGITATTTTEQAISHPGIPSRDANGGTDGDGVLLALEVSGATGSSGTVTTITANYTDQDGNAAQTATMASWPTTAAVGTFVPFQLAAGDTGVRSVEGLTLGTSLVSGTVHLVQYRVLASVMVPPVTSGEGRVGLIELGMPRLYDASVPFLVVLPTTTTLGNLDATVVYTQG